MKKRREKKRRAGRVIRQTLTVLLVLTLFAGASGIGIVAYTAAHLDSEEDLAVMEAMRGSRTTRIWMPRRGTDRGTLTLENYVPEEYDILYGDENMVWADASEIPEELKQAFIAIEDQRFYSHHGVDWGRTAKAALNYVFRFERQFGGSTITQQLVKNVHGEKDISAMRKLKEIIRARRLEKAYSKEEILTYYLNIVPLGHQCTGVKSAARYYFGKELSELSTVECAAIASITNAPARYEPVGHTENNRSRREKVLTAMYERGYLDADEYKAARAAELRLNVTDPVYTRSSRGWYTEAVAAEVIHDLMEECGYSQAAATALVYRGGLEIYCLVDADVQNILETYFQDESHFTVGETVLNGGMVICDSKTGDILGIVGGVGEKKGARLFNRATDGYYQPGSVLKPIALYGPAIEKDLVTYSTVFEDFPGEVNGELWPKNSPSVYQGQITLAEALARSKNTVAVQLYQMLGGKNVYRHLKTVVGLEKLVDGEGGKSDIGPSPLALGQLTYGVTVREMTAAYTAFASGGERAEARIYTGVYDAKGHLLLRKDASKHRIMSEESAYILTKMLEGVVEGGTARRIQLKEIVETAGKTGTSGGDLDKWFVGYTPSYVAGIRCGLDSREAVPPGTHVQLDVWDAVMGAIYRKKDAEEMSEEVFPCPSGVLQCEYCRDSGLIPTDACRAELRGDRTAHGYYKAWAIPNEKCQSHVIAHYDIQEGEFGLGEGNPETALDFYALYLPERKPPEGVIPKDAEYELGAIFRASDPSNNRENSGGL